MSDHISTEEAERIAKRLERMSPWLGIEVARKQLYEASDALRSLAAERDELRTMCKWTGEWLASSEGSVITHADLVTLLPLLERAALGEEGP